MIGMIVALTLVVLKVLNIIEWPMVWVVSPAWIQLAIIGLIKILDDIEDARYR